MQGKEKTFRRKKEKATSLLLSIVVVVISLIGFSNWNTIGIYAGASWVGRLLYPFFHANIIHAMLNAWCLICIIFIYDIKITRLLLAYIVAVTFPIGLSGVVFFLFGSISLEVSRKLYYQLWMVFYIGIGFFFPNTNAWLHLYCYLCGLVYSILNYPIIIQCKKR